MNATTIQKALNASTKVEKQLCSKYASIVKLIAEIKPSIVSATVTAEDITMNFGRETSREFDRVNGWYDKIVVAGTDRKANEITIKTATGEYKFTIPTGNDFYNYLCFLLNIEVSAPAVEVVENIKYSAITCGEFKPALKKAMSFASKDKKATALSNYDITGVCIHFKEDVFHIVGTDAHLLYKSEPIPAYTSKEGEYKFLIPVAAAKEISQIKNDCPVRIDFTDSQCIVTVMDTDKIHTFDLIKANYPNYEAVMPEYTQSMRFDRTELAKNIKVVMPAANKTTHRVKLHLNGSIELQSFDIDFKSEGVAKMSYQEKTFPDMDISFNGKLLITALAAIDGKITFMQSAGNGEKAILLTGEKNNDTILLMPYKPQLAAA